MVQAEPQQTTEPNTLLYSVVQKKPKQTKELPVEPHGTTELNGQYSAAQEAVNMWGKDLDTRKQVVSVYLPCQNPHNLKNFITTIGNI